MFLTPVYSVAGFDGINCIFIKTIQLTASRKLGEARGAVTGKDKIPDAQEFAQIEDAEILVNEVIQRTNSFFNGEWKAYQKQVEATPIKIFQEYKPIE